VAGGSDRTVKLWKLDREGGKETQPFRGHKDWVTAVAFSKDGYYIVSSGVDRILKIWELTSREIPLLAEHTGSVDAVAFSPDGKWIASGASDRTIKIWDRASGVEKFTLTGHTQGVLALAFTPDSKTLVSSGVDRNLRLWDVTVGKEIPMNDGQKEAMQNLIQAVPYFAVPNENTILIWIAIGNDRYETLASYELKTGKENFKLNDQ